jgi:hypothetical protein
MGDCKNSFFGRTDRETTSVRILILSLDALLVLMGALIVKYPHYGRRALLFITPFLSLAVFSFPSLSARQAGANFCTILLIPIGIRKPDNLRLPSLPRH